MNCSLETGILVRTLIACVGELLETPLWETTPENHHIRIILKIWLRAMSCGNPVKQVEVAAGKDTNYIMLQLMTQMQQEHQALL